MSPTLADEIAAQREWLSIVESWVGIWENEAQSPIYEARRRTAEAARATLNRLLAVVPEGEDATANAMCHWHATDDFDWMAWETSCGQSFVLNDGTPAENGMRFCYGCGKLIAFNAQPPTQEDGP